jgi:hypothetical protein
MSRDSHAIEHYFQQVAWRRGSATVSIRVLVHSWIVPH